MGGSVDQQANKLYEELGGLARFVENAMKTIAEVGPQIMSSSAQLPTASSHLKDLNKMTEDGTLEVMRLTEIIQDNRVRISKELRAVVETLQTMDCVTLAQRLEAVNTAVTEDDEHLTEIMTALSFQDLVAQRVKKLVTILDEVQRKLMELVVVFGVRQNGKRLPDNGVADDLLKQLEASNSTAMKQEVADEILAQFGFK
jgi:chemotaxis protein CheZ